MKKIFDEVTGLNDEQLSLEDIIINKDVNERVDSELKLMYHQLNTGIESMLKLDLAIINDKEVISNEEVSVAYLNMSNENYFNIASAIGVQVQVPSLEDNENDPIRTLELSIEAKEGTKKEISKKVDSLIKKLGEKLKDIGKNIKHAFTTNNALLDSLSKTISAVNETSIEFGSTTIATIVKKLSTNNVFAEIKNLDKDNLLKILTDVEQSFNLIPVMEVANVNYKKIIKANYDLKNVKLDKLKNDGFTGNEMTVDTYKNTPESDNIITAVVSPSEGNVSILLATGKENNIYKYMANKTIDIAGGAKGSILNMLTSMLKNKGIIEGASKSLKFASTLDKVKNDAKDVKEISIDLKTLSNLVNILKEQNVSLHKSFSMLENLNGFLLSNNDLNGSEFCNEIWFTGWEQSKSAMERNIFIISKILDHYKK